MMFLAIFISFFIEEDLRRVALSINVTPEFTKEGAKEKD